MTKHKKHITIGFSKPKGLLKQPISCIIRAFEGSKYSHVYIKLKTTQLANPLYYHASGLSVKFMNEKTFNKKNKVVEEHMSDISCAKYYKTLDYAIEKVDTPYSFSQLFGIIIIRLASICGKKISNPFGKKGYICTELVGEILKKIHGKKIEKELNSLTLKDIKKLIEKK